MEMAFLQICIKAIFAENSQNPLNGFNMTLLRIFGIDKNIIQTNDNKDIKFLNQNFVNIALKTSRYGS